MQGQSCTINAQIYITLWQSHVYGMI